VSRKTLWAVALFLGLGGSAYSAIPAAPNPGAKCPYGDATPNDGCTALYAAGLQGTVQFPDAFTNPLYGPGNGQEYNSRLQENQAGVDFPVGLPQSYVGKLKDPMANPPANCAASPTGSAAKGPKLTCGGGPVVIHGYQFGPTGGHKATVLRVNNTATIEDIQFNEFSNDDNTVLSSNANDYAIYLAAPGSTFNSVFSHNTVNGQCHSEKCGLNYQVVAYTSGSKTWDYNAWLWMPVRITAGCSGECPTIGDLNLRWSMVMGHDMTAALHGEWIEEIFAQKGTPTTQAHTNYIGNVVIQPAAAAANSTANIYVSGGSAPITPTYSDVLISDSTLICNRNNGKPICSALIDFQNGTYSRVRFINLAVDASGSIGMFRADCNHGTNYQKANFPTGVAMTNIQNMLERPGRSLVTSFNFKVRCSDQQSPP